MPSTVLRLLKENRLTSRIRAAWRHDAEEAIKPLRKEVRRLTHEIDQLQGLLKDTAARAARGDHLSTQLRLIREVDAQMRGPLTALPSLLDEAAIGAHVHDAIGAADLVADPFPHVVVENLLPAPVYELLLAALPPAAFFDQHDPVKQDMAVPVELAPALTTQVWGFVDEVLGRRIIQPAVLEKFHEPLQRHYDAVFGPSYRDRAGQLPYRASGGRLMLRRPGYVIPPHRDPKRSLLTCLMYLARPGDSEEHGTQLYRVIDDDEAPFKQTYYPESQGRRCELVRRVPFTPNTMLVFLNSHGAHGAGIPTDASAGIERYAYQFYVAPDNDALGVLIRDLPPERREMWQNRNRMDPSRVSKIRPSA